MVFPSVTRGVSIRRPQCSAIQPWERSPPLVIGNRGTIIMEKKLPASSPIPEDMKFQQRAWTIERGGWVAMGVFVALGLLGVFYSGVLSDTAAATNDNGLIVKYERFAHRTARSHCTIRV